MGHVRLRTLPRSKLWREVVELVSAGASVSEVAAASATAAKRALAQAGSDPEFLFVARLLVELPLAARGPGYSKALRELGLDPTSIGSVPSLLTTVSEAVDGHVAVSGNRSDLGEMARAALVEALSDGLHRALPSLLEPTPQEIRQELGRLAGGQRFAGFAREFFSRFVHKSLDYYLSRELANHTGPGKRFETDADRVAFDRALAQHAFETSRIVEEYAGGWYGKTVWRDGDLTEGKIARFASYAFKKLRDELGRRDAAPV